jgi:hypothetical protein
MKLSLDVHDGAIVSYRRDDGGLEVVVVQYTGRLRTLRFEEVHAVQELEGVEGFDPSDPEGNLDLIDEAQYGSLLTAVRDLTRRPGESIDSVIGLKQFDFLDTSNRSMLSVVARGVKILADETKLGGVGGG